MVVGISHCFHEHYLLCLFIGYFSLPVQSTEFLVSFNHCFEKYAYGCIFSLAFSPWKSLHRVCFSLTTMRPLRCAISGLTDNFTVADLLVITCCNYCDSVSCRYVISLRLTTSSIALHLSWGCFLALQLLRRTFVSKLMRLFPHCTLQWPYQLLLFSSFHEKITDICLFNFWQLIWFLFIFNRIR